LKRYYMTDIQIFQIALIAVALLATLALIYVRRKGFAHMREILRAEAEVVSAEIAGIS